MKVKDIVILAALMVFCANCKRFSQSKDEKNVEEASEQAIPSAFQLTPFSFQMTEQNWQGDELSKQSYQIDSPINLSYIENGFSFFPIISVPQARVDQIYQSLEDRKITRYYLDTVYRLLDSSLKPLQGCHNFIFTNISNGFLIGGYAELDGFIIDESEVVKVGFAGKLCANPEGVLSQLTVGGPHCLNKACLGNLQRYFVEVNFDLENTNLLLTRGGVKGLVPSVNAKVDVPPAKPAAGPHVSSVVGLFESSRMPTKFSQPTIEFLDAKIDLKVGDQIVLANGDQLSVQKGFVNLKGVRDYLVQLKRPDGSVSEHLLKRFSSNLENRLAIDS